MKKCSRCLEEKLKSCFNKASKSKDGLHWWCKSCVKEYKESRPDLYKGQYSKYRETIRASDRQWKKNNKDKIKKRTKTDEQKKKRQERDNERYRTDIQFKMAKLLRERLRKVAKKSRSGSAVALLGCSLEEFMLYVESQFQAGMTWQNWSKSGWHLDHKIPLSKFDLSDPIQVSRACHFTNMQPLWAKDNLKKWANLDIEANAES